MAVDERNGDVEEHYKWWQRVIEKEPDYAENTIYARVYERGRDSATVVQYWFFYVYNDAPRKWTNLKDENAGSHYDDGDHEGDWESIQVVFDAPLLKVLVDGELPSELGYAAHEHGSYLKVADVEWEGRRPVVYVALGSHASYPRDIKCHLYKVFYLGTDIADGTGPSLTPSDYRLSLMSGEEAWLEWDGRWGDLRKGPKGAILEVGNGPRGPSDDIKAHWAHRPSELFEQHGWRTDACRMEYQ